MSREMIILSNDPRGDAIAYVTNNGNKTLHVEKFLKAARPGGEDERVAYATHFPAPTGEEKFAPAYKGVSGYVEGINTAGAKTSVSFTIRDDYDFADPSPNGKGYHVNVQLGKETRAYVSGRNNQAEYEDRTNMTGERVYFDGEEAAASWYTRQHDSGSSA